MTRHNTPEAAAGDGPTSRAPDQNAGLVPIVRRISARPDWMLRALAELPAGRPGLFANPSGRKKYLVTETGTVRKLPKPRPPRNQDIIVNDVYAQLRDTHPDDEALRDAIRAHKRLKYCWRPNQRKDPFFDPVNGLVRMYRDRFGDLPQMHRHLRGAKIELAGPGRPDDKRTFRSPWEERLSKALTRLGVRWAYEPRSFDWVDGMGNWHRYTPDFQLPELRLTFVEVKGPRGAPGDDQFKMAQVLGNHPSLTLLLWDSVVVEMVEDMDTADQVLGLLTTTKLAA